MVGTGDLSELALGWMTFNGDHMSSYNVNASIPKTLIQFLIQWYAKEKVDNTKIKKLLDQILETPISPELLPTSKDGKIQQKTEDKIGPYELHDFFLYFIVRYHFSPKKVLFLAQQAFNGSYNRKELIKWLQIFIKRFFKNQFKRSVLPDGPKVGSVALSPRGEWRMPSDVSSEAWIAELNEN